MPQRRGEPGPSDASDTSGVKPEDSPSVVERKPRGPYRTADVSTGSRDGDLLRDPQVAAFLDALNRIRDPHLRAIVTELLRDLAQQGTAGNQRDSGANDGLSDRARNLGDVE